MAENTEKSTKIKFIIDDNTLIGIRGTAKEVIVPEGIKKVAYGVFSTRKSIKRIVFPDSVESIEDDFYGCSGLEELVLPNKDIYFSIGRMLFSGCEKLADEKGLIIIGDTLFACLSDADIVVIPGNITEVWAYAFYMSSVNQVIIPDTVEEIGENALDHVNVEFSEKWGKKHVNDLYRSINVRVIAERYLKGDEKITGNPVYIKLVQKYFSVKSNRNHVIEDAFDVNTYTGQERKKHPEYLAPFLSIGKKYPLKEIDEWIRIAVENKKTDLQAVLIEYKHKYYPETMDSIQVTENDDFGFSLDDFEQVDWKRVFNYTKREGQITISSWKQCDEVLYVPESIDGVPVVNIGTHFYSKSVKNNEGVLHLRKVVLPATVKKIRDYAFSDAVELEEINLENVEEFGNRVFNNCPHFQDDNGFVIINDILYDYNGKNPSVCIPSRVKWIAARAFAYNCMDSTQCKVTEITLTDHVERIDSEAFASTGITTMNIPDSVAVLGKKVFYHCTELLQVHLPSKLSVIPSGLFSGCMALRTVNLNPEITEIGDNAFLGCARFGFDGIETLTKLEKIGKSAFESSGVRGVLSEKLNSLQTIGERAFACSRLTQAVLPDSVKEIGKECFWGCLWLKFVQLGESITVIPESFCSYSKGLTEIKFKGNIELIGREAFRETGLSVFRIPETVKHVGKWIFRDSIKIKDLYIDSDDAEFDVDLLAGCEDVKIHVHRDTFTEKWAKRYAKTKDFTVKTELDDAMDERNFPALEALADRGFLDTKQARDYAFAYAEENQLTDVKAWLMDYRNKTVDIFAEEIAETEKLLKNLSAPVSSVEPEIKMTWNYRKLEDGTLEITAYKGTEQKVTVPSMIGKYQVTKIGKEAFIGSKDAVGLRSVTIPEGITEIGNNAFRNCKKLVQVNLPNSLVVIDSNAFRGCISLRQIEIPEAVKELGSYAFSSCISLRNISVPVVAKVRECVFSDSPRLMNQDGMTIINQILCEYRAPNAEECNVNVPDDVTEIAAQAFKEGNIRKLYIPKTVKSIGDFAFTLISLDEIFIPAETNDIGTHIFSNTDLPKIVHTPEKSAAQQFAEKLGIEVRNDYDAQ